MIYVCTILLIAIGLITTTIGLSAQQPVCAGKFVACELYSWTDTGGEWRFSLLRSLSGVNLGAEQVLDKRFTLSGVEDIEEKIAGLPKESRIYWVERLATGGGPDIRRKETFGYPPSKTIREIWWYAERRSVKIEMVTGYDWFTVPEVGPKR